jgi:hypothetical protein
MVLILLIIYSLCFLAFVKLLWCFCDVHIKFARCIWFVTRGINWFAIGLYVVFRLYIFATLFFVESQMDNLCICGVSDRTGFQLSDKFTL